MWSGTNITRTENTSIPIQYALCCWIPEPTIPLYLNRGGSKQGASQHFGQRITVDLEMSKVAHSKDLYSLGQFHAMGCVGLLISTESSVSIELDIFFPKQLNIHLTHRNWSFYRTFIALKFYATLFDVTIYPTAWSLLMQTYHQTSYMSHTKS